MPTTYTKQQPFVTLRLHKISRYNYRKKTFMERTYAKEKKNYVTLAFASSDLYFSEKPYKVR
jgi:hypothetical protein